MDQAEALPVSTPRPPAGLAPDLSRRERDRRSRRSKATLHLVLLALLEEKSLSRITIDEIVSRAGIGRATFYRHFATKEQLVSYVAASEMETWFAASVPMLNHSDVRRSCETLCSHVWAHRRVWSALLNGGAFADMRAALLDLSLHSRPDQMKHDTTVPFEVGSIVGTTATLEILAWWLRQSEPMPVQEVAALIDRLVNVPLLEPISAAARGGAAR